jgi:hypothetical protein
VSNQTSVAPACTALREEPATAWQRIGSTLRSMRAASLVLVAVLAAGCGSSAPNLDEAVAGQPPASIRAAIVRHLNWGDRLTEAELDNLASFIAESAGETPAASGDVPNVSSPGRAVWTANHCGSCHVLAAGAEGD